MLEGLPVHPVGERLPAGFAPANRQAFHHGPQHYSWFHVGNLCEVPQDRLGIIQRSSVFQLAVATLLRVVPMVRSSAVM